MKYLFTDHNSRVIFKGHWKTANASRRSKHIFRTVQFILQTYGMCAVLVFSGRLKSSFEVQQRKYPPYGLEVAHLQNSCMTHITWKTSTEQLEAALII